MNDSNARDEQTLWVRFVSGDPLSRDEGQRLTDWIGNEELQDVFLDDLETDRSLRSVAALASTEEQFLESTLERFEDLRRGEAPRRQPRPLFPAPGPSLAPLLSLAAAVVLAFGLGLSFDRLRAPDPVLLDGSTFVSTVANQETQTGVPLPARLGAGPLQLPEGEARLAFDSGATVDVVGPATLELVDEDEIYLIDGRAQADVPAELSVFVVRTPTTRIAESGTTFDITVQDDGETEVRLLQGELSVEPGRQGNWAGRDLRLSSDRFSAANVDLLVPDLADAPVVLEAQGEGGQYTGLIVANGRSMEIARPESTRAFRTRFRQILSDDPEQFHMVWSQVAPEGGVATLQIGDGPPKRLRFDEQLDLFHELSVIVTTEEIDGQWGVALPHIEPRQIVIDSEGTTWAFQTQLRSQGEQEPRFPTALFSGKLRIGGEASAFQGAHELHELLRPNQAAWKRFGLRSDARAVLGVEFHDGDSEETGNAFRFFHRADSDDSR